MEHQPDPIAQLDQALAATRDFAKAAAGFYKELLEQGVAVEAAVMMTNGYVSSIVIASINRPDEE